MRDFIRWTPVPLVVAATACAQFGLSPKRVSAPVRLHDIERAQVWDPTDVASMDITAGPQGRGAFAPNETVSCTYVDKKMEGASPKFTCAIEPGDEVKVKFGQDNGEVYGEVAATRLLWALGFGADPMYPVRVICRGCPAALQPMAQSIGGALVFDVAAIERKMPGREIDGPESKGWGWPELDLVEPTAGGAPRAHRDALKLLAVFIQHTDTKPAQQRLICRSEKRHSGDVKKDGHEADDACPDPFMMINDLGLTFGVANEYNRQAVASVNLKGWAKTPVWRDGDKCVGNLPKSLTGTLDNPVISEEGRQFLAGLLVQLSDAQVRALFEVARFPTKTNADDTRAGQPVDAWVTAFKDKVAQVVNRTCPPDRPQGA